jgi:CRISPR system Cascade subunit CasB
MDGALSEARVNRLLAARGAAFRAQVRRAARILAGAGVPLPYRELGLLVLAERRQEQVAERLRLGIARDYWRTRPRERDESNENLPKGDAK